MGVLSAPLHSARLALAAYRSSLNSLPSFAGLQHLSLVTPLNVEGIPEGMFPNGAVFYWRGRAFSPMIVFKPTPKGLLHLVANVSFIGTQSTGYVVLDDAEWKNVTFVNMLIVYGGGPVILDNARFVNCHFKVVSNGQGEEVTEYIALGSAKLRVG